MRIGKKSFKVPKKSLLPPIDEPGDEEVWQATVSWHRSHVRAQRFCRRAHKIRAYELLGVHRTRTSVEVIYTGGREWAWSFSMNGDYIMVMF